MRDKSKKMLRTAFDILTKLDIYPMHTMLTGSIALDAYGLLPDDRDIHDIDLILGDWTDTQKSILNVLQAANVSPADYPVNDFYKFTVQGVTINIWLKQFDTPGMKVSTPVGYIWLSPVKDILDKKKEYGRKKDYSDIAAIAAHILK